MPRTLLSTLKLAAVATVSVLLSACVPLLPGPGRGPVPVPAPVPIAPPLLAPPPAPVPAAPLVAPLAPAPW